MVAAIVANGANLDEPIGPKDEKAPPLLIAAAADQWATVKPLLGLGANPYVKDPKGAGLHHLAVQSTQSWTKWAQGVIERIPGFDYSECIAEHNFDKFETSKQLTILHLAAANPDPSPLRWILSRNDFPDVNGKSQDGCTPLVIAASEGILENCKLLCAAGASALDSSSTGTLPLHLACFGGFTEVCEYLLSVDHGALARTDENGTPLEVAAKKGHLQVVQILLHQDAYPSVKAEAIALCAGRRDIADLIRRTRTESDAEIQTDMNPDISRLAFVYKNGTEEDLLDLIHAELSPNARIDTENQETALLIATRKGWCLGIKALLTQGADVDCLDSSGCTPLMHAASLVHLDCVKLLLEYGARPDLCSINGRSTLHAAALGNRLQILSYLLEKGMDANAKDCYGETSLSFTSNIECVRVLLQHGADPFAISRFSSTPVYRFSTLYGSGEFLRELLQDRSPEDISKIIDLRDWRYNSTALYLASFRGFAVNVQILVEHGADVNLPGGSLGTPVQAAFKQGHVEVVRILLEHGAKPFMMIRNGEGLAAWFWEHGCQFLLQTPTGAWTMNSMDVPKEEGP